MRRPLVALGCAVLVLGAVRPAASDGPDRPAGSGPAGWSVRDVDDPFAGTAQHGVTPATHVAVRVIDAETGRGIAGAKLWGVGEATHPLPRLVGTKQDFLIATTDADGWARTLAEDGVVDEHTLVLADGYAPRNEWEGSSPTDALCALVHGEDLPVELRDPLDRPVANALVGYRLYCGHTPDVRQSRTDALGRAVIHGIDRLEAKWLWSVAEGFTSEDIAVGGGYGWSGKAFTVRLAWGPVVEGKVLDAKGGSVAGAAVGARSWHRGPWTFTDARGAFRLVGAEPFDALQIDPNDEAFGKEGSVYASAPPAGTPLVVRLSDPASKAAAAPEPTFPIRVRIEGPDGESPPEDERVRAWRTTDGLAVEGKLGDGDPEVHTIDLPAGSWVVDVGAIARPGATSVGAPVVVQGPASITVKRPPWRTLRVAGSALGEADQVFLATATLERDVTLEARKGVIRAPLDEDAILRVQHFSRSRLLAVPRGVRPADAPPVAIEPPDPTAVTLRLAAPDGTPARGRVAIQESPWTATEEDSKVTGPLVTSSTELDGIVWLVVEPEDATLAARVVALDLGVGERKTIGLGEIRFAKREECRVVLEGPTGVPKPSVTVLAKVAGANSDDRSGAWQATAASEEPAFLPFAPPPGSSLVGRAEGCVSVRVTISGPGPFTVSWPKGMLEVAVGGGTGAASEQVMVLLDGEPFRAVAPERVVSVGGIASGEHRVLVSAPGRMAREYRATWKDGEAKKLDADLAPLPPPEPGAKPPR